MTDNSGVSALLPFQEFQRNNQTFPLFGYIKPLRQPNRKLQPRFFRAFTSSVA